MKRGKDSLPIDGEALKRAIRARGYTCAIVSAGIGMSRGGLYNVIWHGMATKQVRDLIRERFGIEESCYVSSIVKNETAAKETPEARPLIQLPKAEIKEVPSDLKNAIKQAILEALRELVGGAA